METKTKMMIAGGVLALVVTIIVIVVVNNKEDEKPKGEKPKGEKPKGEKPKGETPPPAKCQSGQYKDTKGVCTLKSKTGQFCGKDGDDTSCETGVCGQYRNNEYKCCDKSSTLWTFSDWCVNLKKGDGCHKDGQCTSGKCNSHKCV